MRISDWSSDVCSSDLVGTPVFSAQVPGFTQILHWDSESNSHELQLISPPDLLNDHLSFVGGIYYLRERFKTSAAYQFGTFGCNLEIGRASCRERVCQYVYISVDSGYLKKKIENK